MRTVSNRSLSCCRTCSGMTAIRSYYQTSGVECPGLLVSSGLVKSQLPSKGGRIGVFTMLDKGQVKRLQVTSRAESDSGNCETSQVIAAPTVSSDRQTRTLTVEKIGRASCRERV